MDEPVGATVSVGGGEHELRHGDHTAVVVEVGGGLRVLRHGERDLVRPYAADEVRPRYRGALLAPWPNRVVDGRYTFDGTTYQLALTEPERGHALHGLVAWSRFDLVDREEASVTAVHRLVPRTSYPWELEIRAHYRLGDDGLTCEVVATNLAEQPAPFGVAAHPYLVAGEGPVDRWTLELPASQVLGATPDRLVPTGLAPTAGTDFDFTQARSLAGLEVDHAFTGLAATGLTAGGGDGDRLVRARVRGEDGSGAEMVWDPTDLPWVQVHTADLPPPEISRAGMAIEPMTCPPDAFNSGTDLRVLPPGGSTSAVWRIAALSA